MSSTGKPLVGYQWAKKFKYAVEKYNSIYKEPLPKITPHVCRHTFCTRQWQRGLNIKTIQALMGHASIEVTMDTYTHATYQDIVKEVNQAVI
ncbi:MAG: tyrosine-type recombinase/integrase [Coprococcus comes]